MWPAVIDENVLIVANDASRVLSGKNTACPQADDSCRISAIEFLAHCRSGKCVVIDDIGLVIEKYREYMHGSGQPGSGDAFFRYLVENQYNPQRVRQVSLELHRFRGFEKFPNDIDLRRFDPADRIFVALGNVTGGTITNCVDSDYSEYAGALQSAGINVRELCPNCLRVRG